MYTMMFNLNINKIIEIIKKINDAINDVVDNITLQDLVDWQSEKNGSYII